MVHYGHFSKDNSEYVIENPMTPRPWINYLTNGAYTAVVSQFGGGYSFYGNCKNNKIIPWDPIIDSPGRYIYIKEKSTGAIWSPTYQPICADYSYYKARHGLGYTVISSESARVSSEITYFVPMHDSCEIWIVTLTNNDSKKKNLQLFPYCEWFIRNTRLCANVWYNKRDHIIYADNTAGSKTSPQNMMFFSSSLPVKEYATQKTDFLGRYNTIKNPESVISGKMHNTQLSTGEDSIAAFQHEISLEPKKSRRFIVLGRAEKTSEVHQMVKKYHSSSKLLKELNAVKDYWKSSIESNICIKTPDPALDELVNIWLKYQILVCSKGSGCRTFREACHHAEAVTPVDPSYSKEIIHSLASLIREDGTCAPGWTDRCGPSQEKPLKDNPVWLTFAVSSYVKETGDKEILKQQLPYLRDKYIKGWYIDPEFKEELTAAGSGSLFEHLWRNLNFCFHDVDECGLPRIGHADIHAALNGAGIQHKGGSVWLGQALVRALKILARLSDLVDERTKATELRKRAVIMTERIEKYWDGGWYTRGVTDEGMVFGSHKNKEGKIFLDSQIWAVLSGIVQGERLAKLFKSIEKLLETPYGYALLGPAFSEYDSKIGTITQYPQGTGGNGSIVCADNALTAVAYCMSGQGDKAYQTLLKVLPCFRDNIEKYKSEPYVSANTIIGAEHPYRAGAGMDAWETASAGFLLTGITEWLLGIRPELNGFIIDPCIPGSWKKFSIIRNFRNIRYDITVENPHGVEKGIKEIFVNKEKILNNLIVPKQNQKQVTIKVVLCRSSSKKGVLKQKISAAI